MSATTTSPAIIGLSDETLDKLRELRRLNVDAAKGFDECSEMVDAHGLDKAFTEIASKRRTQAEELENQIDWNGDCEKEDGSYLAALHRTWIQVRKACSSDDVATVLSEAQRGEETLRDAYQDAINDLKASPICELLTKQLACVTQTHAKLESLHTARTSDS